MKTATYKEAVQQFEKKLDVFEDILTIIQSPKKLTADLKEIREKAKKDTFKVLVIGRFSSGKSTMINALLGEPILPERATTATAIITEIRYGTEKEAIAYPKKGQWSGGDDPVSVPVNELKKYLLINHNVGEGYNPDSNVLSGNVIASPFEKMEIFWPLDILKDGVEIIDSPGMDDPTCHGLIAKNYLPNADAIIYVMTGLNAYSAGDVNELENIRRHHFNTPIFVITRYDNVCEDAEENAEDPKQYLQEYRKKVFSDVSHHTDLVFPDYVEKLGKRGVFFVSSKQAKQAKRSIPVNYELLSKSGYAEFEKYLSDYLVKLKGDELLKLLCEKIKSVGNDAANIMAEQLRAADTPLIEFEEKIEAVKGKMELAKKQAELFVGQFNMGIEKLITSVTPEIQGYIEGAKSAIPEWTDSYHTSVEGSLLHPKRMAEAITNECIEYFKGCYERYTIEWSERVLIPKIQDGIHDLAKQLEERCKNLDKTIHSIKLDLDFVETAESETSSSASKIVSVIYGLATFDAFGAVAGFSSGFEGLLKGIVTNIGINLALIIIFGTVSLPLVIIGEIINFLIVGASAKGSMEKKVRKKISKEYTKMLNDPEQQKKIYKQINEHLSTEFQKIKDVAAEAAHSDLSQIQMEIDQLRESKKLGTEAVEARKIELKKGLEMIESNLKSIEEIHRVAIQ